MSKEITDMDTLIPDESPQIDNDRGNDDSEYIGYEGPEEDLDNDDESVAEDQSDIDENLSDDESGEEEDATQESNDDQITPDLVYEAASKGLSLEDIQGFSASELRKTLNIIKAPQQEVEELIPQKEVKTIEWDRDNFDDDQNAVFDQFKEQFKDYDAVNNALKEANQKIDSLQEYQNQNDAKVFMTSLDGMINELGDEFHDVLGEGKSMDLGKGHLGNEARYLLVDHMGMLIDGHKAHGKQLSEKDAFKMAINNLYPEKQKKIVNDSIKKKLGSQKGGMSRSGRSTSKNSMARLRNLSATQKAENAVADKLKEFGVGE